MALDVTVNIELSKPTGNIGEWFPLLHVVDTNATSDVYVECKDLSDVVTAGYTTETDTYKAANMIFMQDNAPNKIAILKQSSFATATFAPYLTKGWHQMLLIGAERTDIATISNYIETVDRMLFINCYDDEDLTTGSPAANVYTNDRTVVLYHENATVSGSEVVEDVAAALVGATAGLEIGSFTYKNIVLKGVTANDLSDAEIAAIHNKGAIAIVEKAGDIVTSDGKSAGGEYADILDSKDFVTQNIRYKTQKVFNNNAKVPYTNAGIGMLETATLEALVEANNHGIIATKDDGTPDYSVSFALRSDTTEANRAARSYPYGTFAFSLAGAIHTATINGTVSI